MILSIRYHKSNKFPIVIFSRYPKNQEYRPAKKTRISYKIGKIIEENAILNCNSYLFKPLGPTYYSSNLLLKKSYLFRTFLVF